MNRIFTTFLIGLSLIFVVGCGSSPAIESASIWSMSQQDFQSDQSIQRDQIAKIESVEHAVNRLVERLDSSQQDQQVQSLKSSSMAMESESNLQWNLTSLSLQSDTPQDLKDYLDSQFAALATKINDSCQCSKPIAAQNPSTRVPELFEPPSQTSPVYESITTYSEPMPIYSQPVTTYSDPVIYSTMPQNYSCENGQCRPVTQSSSYFQTNRQRRKSRR